MDERLYHTIREVENLLRVSEETVRRMISRGELEAVRVSARSVRIPSASISALTSNQVGRT